MSLFNKLIKNDSGIAALEFAIFAPLLITLLFGGFETTRYILVNQKAEKVAYTITDVVTQNQALTTNQLNQIVAAAGEIMNPLEFDDNGVVIITSVLQQAANVPPVVRWQYVGGGTLEQPSQIGVLNGSAAMPEGMVLNLNDNVIITEVYYQYAPVFGSSLIGEDVMYKTTIFKPRLGTLTTPPS